MKNKKMPKKYKIYDKIGTEAVASILMDKYHLKLYRNRETLEYMVFYNTSTIKAYTLGELMYLVEIFFG